MRKCWWDFSWKYSMFGWKIYPFKCNNNVKSADRNWSDLLSYLMNLRVAENNLVGHYTTPYQKVSVLCSDGIMYFSDGVHLMRISWVAIWRVDQGGVWDGITIQSSLLGGRVRQAVDDGLRLHHFCGHHHPHPGQLKHLQISNSLRVLLWQNIKSQTTQ